MRLQDKSQSGVSSISDRRLDGFGVKAKLAVRLGRFRQGSLGGGKWGRHCPTQKHPPGPEIGNLLANTPGCYYYSCRVDASNEKRTALSRLYGSLLTLQPRLLVRLC